MRIILLLTLALSAIAEKEYDFYDFATDIYMTGKQNATDNFVVSPISAKIVLDLAKIGTYGPIIQKHLKNLNPTSANQQRSLNENFIKNTTNIAIYREATKMFRKADTEKIGKWVRKQTNGYGHGDYFKGTNINSRMENVLVNSVFFSGNFSHPFNVRLTYDHSFYFSPNHSELIRMMHMYQTIFPYYEDKKLKLKIMRIPYNGVKTHLTVILPNEKDGIPRVEKYWKTLLSINPDKLKPKNVNVALPKFRAEYNLNFLPVLEQMVQKQEKVTHKDDAVQNGGSEEVGDGDTETEDILHTARIDVGESGVKTTNALSWNNITMAFIPVPIMHYPEEFIVDHPFLFYVTHKGFIKLIGRVMKPELP